MQKAPPIARGAFVFQIRRLFVARFDGVEAGLGCRKRGDQGGCDFGVRTARLDHNHIAVGGDLFDAAGGTAGACRDQTTDDHVLFQADQFVALALNRSLGQHPRGFLERRRRDEAAGLQRRLGDAQQDRLGSGLTHAVGMCLFVGLVEFVLVDVFALEQRGFARVENFELLQHLANDHLDVLVVDFHALQTIDVLHFVDHVVRQRFDTQDTQDVMRRGVAVHDVVALLHEVAFLHRNMFALRHHVFHRGQRLINRLDGDAALVLVVFAEADVAIGFRDDRVIFRATGFEQFGHAGKTPGDVLGLGTFARNTRHNVAGADVLTVFDGQNRVHRHRVARIRAHRIAGGRVHDDHFRLQIVALGRGTPVGDDLLRHAGGFVGVFAHRDARNQIDKARDTGLFGDDRQGVGVPFEQLGAAFHGHAVLGVDLGAIGQLVNGAVLTRFVHDGDDHVPAHHDLLAVDVRQQVVVAELDLALLAGLQEGLLATLGDTADVEGPHRQLGAGFTDGLGGDDADCFALVHQGAARKVTAIAHRADAFFGVAGQRRTDTGRGHACLMDQVGATFVDQLATGDDHIGGAGHQNVIGGHTAQHTFGQGLHHFAIVHSHVGGDAAIGAAIMRAHDAILRHVHQTAGQVARVCRLQRGIRETLTGAVGRVEVFKNGQTFLEVRDDRRFDDLARRLGHKAAHTAKLLHLGGRTPRTGVRHHVDRVRLFFRARVGVTHGGNFGHHLARDLVRALRPGIDNLVILLALSDQAVHILLFEFLHLIADFVDDGPLGVGDQHVVLAERDTGLERLAEAQTHDLVAEDHRLFLAAVAVDGVDDGLHVFLPQQAVHQIERGFRVQRQKVAQAQTAGGGFEPLPDDIAVFVDLFQAALDLGVQVNGTGGQGVFHLVHIGESHAFTDHALAFHGGVIQAKHHILRRNDNRRAVGGRQHVVRRHHQNARFKLGFQRERDVNSHLVAVEVGVKGRADQRVKLDRLAFDQDRFERLNPQTVQRGRTVQKDRVFADDFIKDIPNLGTFLFHQLFGLLYGRGQTFGPKPRVDEGLEQFERHLLRQTALVQLQLGTGHDDRTTREVDALAEQVLTEAALFAFQHVGQRFQRALVGAGDDTATTAVVEQGVNSLLQHALFVTHDDVGRTQFDQTLQAVVAVDDATIEVVQVRGRKAATIQRNQRAQFRRNDRKNGQNHPLRTVAGFEEGFHDLQTLDDLFRLQFAGGFFQISAKLLCGGLKINRGQHFTDRFGADIGGESVGAILVLRVEIFFFGQLLLIGQVGQTRLDHDVVFEIQHTLQIPQGHVEHQADPAGQRFQEPDVGDWGRQFDVAHPFTADLLQRDFNTAFFADNAAIFHALVFAAQAFVILDRAKDTRAEQAVTFRLERAVVDGFRFLDLTERPRQNPLGRGQADLDFVEGLDGRNRVERVGREFLVHFIPYEWGRRSEGAKIFRRKIFARRIFIRKIFYSSSASRRSMFRPKPRTSLTRTVNDSGTPASKLSSPLTIDS